VLGGGAPRHAEAVIREHLARTRDMAHHPVEDAPPMPVVVHAELEEMAQKAPALRYAEGEHVTNAGALGPPALGGYRVRRAVEVGLMRPSELGYRVGAGGTGRCRPAEDDLKPAAASAARA